MALRSKMSTARSRGRAVTTTTTEYDFQPEAGWLYYEGEKWRKMTAAEQARANAEYDKDFPGVRKPGMDVVISGNEKETYKDPFSGNTGWSIVDRNPPKKEPTVKKPTKEEMAADLKASASKVKPKDKFLPLKKVEPGSKRDLITKEKAAKEDINVPQVVEGPKGRTKSKTVLTTTNKRTGNTVTWRKNALASGDFGKKKLKETKTRLTTVTTEVPKNARLSERMKYKKEEKLAGARERVLGMSGVALEDQINKSGRVTKRGEKIEGSAQRLRDLKSLYSPDPSRPEKIKKMTDVRGSGERTAALKEAKADIKEIGKLSRGQAKGIRTEGSAKGRAITKAKSMMAEAKSAAKPKKFSKDTGVSGLEEDLKAIKSAKSPAEIKAMKSSARTAMKEARGMKRTAEEKKMIRTGVKGTRGVAKEARSFKGDIRKGLRMEKRDVRGMNASDLASKAKKDKLAAKGKTLKGTGYFTMENLNKTIPLSQASNVSKYKEEKVKLTREEKKGMASKKPSTNVFMLASKAEKAKRGAKTYNESQGIKQAGSKRFFKK